MTDKCKKILRMIEPHSDFDVTDYYGVSIIKIKATNKYRLKLMHDYNSNSILSKGQIELSSFDKAMTFYKILDDGALNKCGIVNADDIDLDEPEPDDTKCEECQTTLDDGRCPNEKCSKHEDKEW